jgi:Domain of unknown function (DUF4431)
VIRVPMTVAMAGLALSVARFIRGAQSTCAHYEPEVVHLSGHLAIDKEYGPPNYGETPAKDEKLHVAILHLTHPLDVCGDTRDATTSESFKGLQVVQLNFSNLHTDPRHYADQTIAVKGTLYRAISGYHYTDVLMTVDSVGRVQ